MIQASTIAFLALVVVTVNAFTTFEREIQNAPVRRDNYLRAGSVAKADTFTTFEREIQNLTLTRHNYYRARHCAPPLKLDEQLNTIAQNYADYLGSTQSFQHSNNGYGENLYMSGSSVPITTVNGYQATDAWYDEIKYYNYNRPGFSSQTGHFTQVVWEGSTRLGVGIGFSYDDRQMYVVTNYSPPGNFQGQFNENVSPANC